MTELLVSRHERGLVSISKCLNVSVNVISEECFDEVVDSVLVQVPCSPLHEEVWPVCELLSV